MKDNLDLAMSNMSQGLCLFDEDEALVLCNERFYEILGLSPEKIHPGTTYTQLLCEMHDNENQTSDSATRKMEQERESHLAALAHSREVFSYERTWNHRSVVVSHRRLPKGGWVSTIDDVTERKRIEDRIRHLAHHDALTQMPNRAAFHSQVEERLKLGKPSCMLYLNLDRFKPVNDTLGHPVGDRVLQAVAERIGAQLRKCDVAGRLGGDEFAVLLGECNSFEIAKSVANRLIQEIIKPVGIQAMDVSIGVSIGIALGSRGSTAEELLRNADLAMYAAKQGGRGGYRCYEGGMELVLQERQQLEADLRYALAHDEFALHYQPIMDLSDNTIRGYEALLRWTSASRGLVSPADFIPFAEEISLMPEIGDWVMRTACKEAATWNAGLYVAINLSPTQFRLPNLVERIFAILHGSGLPPHRLELEITETAMMGDINGAKAILDRLRACGVMIALDDFGTGYSSLSFLRSLPFTRIKIDRSFVQDLGNTPEALAIVRAVTGLCSSLGVAATAEGVETEGQMKMLQAEGCLEAQGYLLGRPRCRPQQIATNHQRSPASGSKIAQNVFPERKQRKETGESRTCDGLSFVRSKEKASISGGLSLLLLVALVAAVIVAVGAVDRRGRRVVIPALHNNRSLLLDVDRLLLLRCLLNDDRLLLLRGGLHQVDDHRRVVTRLLRGISLWRITLLRVAHTSAQWERLFAGRTDKSARPPWCARLTPVCVPHSPSASESRSHPSPSASASSQP